MGKLKAKIIDVQEYFLNGYDVDDIPYLTDLTLAEVEQILKDFGVAEEDMRAHNESI